MIVLGVLVGCSGDDEPEESAKEQEQARRRPAATTSRVALDAQAFCEKAVTSCGDPSTPVDDCVAMFAAVRVTRECASALEEASCADLSDVTAGGLDAVCFPSCEQPGAQACNPDGTLSVCGNASKALVYDCAATCEAVGKSWAGKCGLSDDGQTAEKEKCWCK